MTDLKKRFGSKVVLDGLNLSVPEHSVFGFVGRNGAGKTTAMKAVLGCLKPDAGKIAVSGKTVIYGKRYTNRYIGYLPDVPEFYPYMTPVEYLNFCGEICEMEQPDIRDRSIKLLSLVGLKEEKDRRIRGFSRGMKQRLGIAQALLHRPALLICDEPTSALDPVGRKEILDLLFAVRGQTTVFFSTHILSDVERICTDVAFLHEGKIAVQDKVSELRKRRASETIEIVLTRDEDVRRLLERFSECRQVEKNTLVFDGDGDKIFSILKFAGEKELSVQRVERMEPSLESLFLEVMKR